MTDTSVIVLLSLSAATFAWGILGLARVVAPLFVARTAHTKLIGIARRSGHVLVDQQARPSETPSLIREVVDVFDRLANLPEGRWSNLANFVVHDWAPWAIREEHRDELVSEGATRKLAYSVRALGDSLTPPNESEAYQGLVGLCRVPLPQSRSFEDQADVRRMLMADLEKCSRILDTDEATYDTAKAEEIMQRWAAPDLASRLGDYDLPILVFARTRLGRLSSRSEVVTAEADFRDNRQAVARMISSAADILSDESSGRDGGLALITSGGGRDRS